MSMSQYGMALSLIGGISGFAWLAVQVAFLVVVLGTVKRERPDAWQPFAVAIAIEIVGAALQYGAGFAMSFALGQGGAAAYAVLGTQLLARFVSIGARVLFLIAVVRLARPPAAKAPWP